MPSTPAKDRSLADQGRAIVEALGGQWQTSGGMCRCPAHDDATPSLSVRRGRRQLLFHCFAGCDSTDVLRALRGLRLETGSTATAVHPDWDTNSASRLSSLAGRLWSDARPVAGSRAAHYLRGRGLTDIPGELRFHPRTPHGRSPVTSFRPALIAAVRDDAWLVGIHRTFLDIDRSSAGASEAKRALGRLGSGAVRFGRPKNDALGLAEGIETALSATKLTGIPCWAALGTERFRHVAIPASVRTLILFLDNDAGGRRAESLAREAHARFERTVEARYPADAGEDWNDALCHLLGITGSAGEESDAAVKRTG